MISVIIPTYNRAGSITRAAMSVLSQTYQDLELIIVDDGSTDDTESVISAIGDPRINYVKLANNQGANAARNRGIQISRGQYIAFNDSDDAWLPEKLEKQIAFLKQKDADVVACTFEAMDGTKFSRWQAFREPRQVEFSDLFPGNVVSTQTMLGKRECFIQQPFNVNMPRLQDWELVIRLVQHYRVFLDTEPFVKVCLQGERISSDKHALYAGIHYIFHELNNSHRENELSKALASLFDFFYRESLNQCCALEAQCYALEEQRDEVQNAFFWKITKPLRKITDVVKHALRNSKAAHAIWNYLKSSKNDR